MIRDSIKNLYFEWLYRFVCTGRYRTPISYRKLLMFLHNTKFVYFLPMDKNRANDGEDLRYRFIEDCAEYNDKEILRCLDDPCSVFEMMVALAIRCEETIMDDPQVGSRTGQWFWGMINNLGLGAMIDEKFDKNYVKEIVDRFLNRDYEPDGRGGLFTIRHCEDDLRNVEIWNQLCWYLDSIS